MMMMPLFTSQVSLSSITVIGSATRHETSMDIRSLQSASSAFMFISRRAVLSCASSVHMRSMGGRGPMLTVISSSSAARLLSTSAFMSFVRAIMFDHVRGSS